MKFSKIVGNLSVDLERVEQAIQDNFHSDVVLIPDVSGHLSNSGGKRIRPLLMLLSSRACGYKGPRAIIHSVVVEYIHTATLLHDDVVDSAEVRRGSESANTKWGNEASVLVGDFLFARSFSMMAEDGNSEILKTMSDACTLLSEGEVLQLVNMYNIRFTEEQYLDVIYRKTAALIAASCRVGALLGEGSPPIVNALDQFGAQVGYAFQLVDDALDYMGDEERTGKEVGKDLREGNITMPLLRVCSSATPEEFERINQIVIQSDEIAPDDFSFVMGLMDKYKSIPYTLDRARSYVEAAKSALSALPDSTHVDSLCAIADYVVERDY
jgi:octaprenyl-diphosphate synthase